MKLFDRIRIWAVIICTFANYPSQAQLREVVIEINGLTCSACTKSVEMQLTKLKFVQKVDMNLQRTSGQIFFKDSADIDFNQIARAVVDAGFSVRKLIAIYNLENTDPKDKCLSTEEGNIILLENIGNEQPAALQIMGEDFLVKSDHRKWRSRLINTCNFRRNKFYYALPIQTHR